MKRVVLCFLTLVMEVGIAGWARPAVAATISFAGDLRTDASVTSCGPACSLGAGNTDSDYAQYAAVVVGFNVPTTSIVQAISFSYGGGVNGASTAIPEGGLEPYLSLFDASGNFLASTYLATTCPPGANTNSSSGQCFDVLLDGGALAAGNYQISLSAYANMSLAENLGAGNLSDGFTGLGNLASGEDLHYAFDVVLTPTSPVPEPSTGVLLSSAGLLLFLRSRKQRDQNQ